MQETDNKDKSINISKKVSRLVTIAIMLTIYLASYMCFYRYGQAVNNCDRDMGRVTYLDITTEKTGNENQSTLIVLHYLYWPINTIHSKMLGGLPHSPILPLYRVQS